MYETWETPVDKGKYRIIGGTRRRRWFRATQWINKYTVGILMVLNYIFNREPFSKHNFFLELVVYLVICLSMKLTTSFVATIFTSIILLGMMSMPPHNFSAHLLLFLVVCRNITRERWDVDEELSNPTDIDWDVYQHSFGVPGGHVGANTDFGARAGIGAQGERNVADVLSGITVAYPFVRVFHGLCFTPGKKGADIDHIVVIGRKVFLIDAKFWRYGEYTFSHGEFLRNGEYFRGGKVHMDAAGKMWWKYLHRPVRPIIVLAQEDSSKYIVDPDELSFGWLAHGPVPLMTIDDMRKMLMKEAAKVSRHPFVNVGLIGKICSQLQ